MLRGLAASRLRRLLPCPSRLSRKRLSTLTCGCPASRARHQPPSSHRYRMGARKAVADVMWQARSDPARLQTKLANDGGHAVNKLRNVFGDQPTNALLEEQDKQAQIRATNNLARTGLALGGSKTAMAPARQR